MYSCATLIIRVCYLMNIQIKLHGHAKSKALFFSSILIFQKVILPVNSSKLFFQCFVNIDFHRNEICIILLTFKMN